MPAAEAQELTPAEKIDKEVWLLSDGIVDDFGTTWKLRAVHHDDSHYISYEAKINGEYASISGPHKNGNYHAHISWPAGDNLLKVLNAYGLSNYNETNLDAALKWVQQAHDLAEAAINTHVNQARTAAALRKLEQQRDEAIADLNQKFEKQASEIQQKAGLSPS
ncbi:MAG: hypothetical protein A2076_16720 [Geobacteraceae bacterium GWC2_53_11]|nr:MAG: hypothetical protein A2076_16720 [Geobacteraceae bacterium GWC2_53_11]